MIFKHEITWDGVAIIGGIIAVSFYFSGIQHNSQAAQVESAAVAAHQVVQDEHLGKLDTAIVLLSQIVAERTGKPVDIPPTRN